MGFLSWIIIGGIAGWIASKLMDTDHSMGVGANIITGIIGGFIGGLIMNLLGGSGVTGFNIWSLIVAVIGSVILLWIVKKVKSRN